MAERRSKRRLVAFRGMLGSIFTQLSDRELKFVAFAYKESQDIASGYDLAERLLQSESICDCVDDLDLLKDTLAKTKRNDLKHIADDYIAKWKPPLLDSLMVSIPILTPHPVVSSSSMEMSTEQEYDFRRAALCTPLIGKKRCRVEEAAAVDALMIECDSTADSSDETVNCTDDITAEDKKFMELAQEAAKFSRDKRTKVGAVIVDHDKREVLGRGWNRMPEGCEEQFAAKWDKDSETDRIEEGKYLYVVYAIRAAIFDAYRRKADLTDSILYTTLYPSNICAQCIRDAGISEVMFMSDKFHKYNFMKASRRIMKGIKCRQYNEQDISSELGPAHPIPQLYLPLDISPYSHGISFLPPTRFPNLPNQ